jgi:DNA-binding CsgD family transcriptional regulator
MLTEAQYDEIIEAIYESALDPLHWRAVVDLATKAFDVIGTSIYTPFASTAGLEPIWSTDADPEFISEYASKYADSDIVAPIIWRRMPSPTFTYCWEDVLESKQEYAVYQDLLKPRGIEQAIGLVVGAEDHRASQLMIYCPDWNAGQINAAKEDFMRLGRHFSRAMRVHWHLSVAKQAADATRLTLNMFQTGVMWLSTSCEVLYTNREMDRILELTDGLRLHAGKLALDDVTLQRRVIDAIANAADRHESAFLIDRPSQESSFRLTIMPLPIEASALRLPNAMAIAFVSTAPTPASGNVEVARQMYQLTPAETRVLGHLLAGQDANATAGILGSSVLTVRTQIRAILEKCQVSRQAELIRLIASLPQLNRR